MQETNLPRVGTSTLAHLSVGNSNNSNLSSGHRELLHRYRISDEVIDRSGVYSANDRDVRSLLSSGYGHYGSFGQFKGHDLRGMVFPYHGNSDARVRFDDPPFSNGRDVRYYSTASCAYLFAAPVPEEWWADTAVPVVLVEAEKSALAILSMAERAGKKLLPIACGGCWGWKRTRLEGPIDDREPVDGWSETLDRVAWSGRTVYVAFDANAAENGSVRRGRWQLDLRLKRKGATPLNVTVPAVEGVNGPDDFIAVKGDEAMWVLLETATPWERPKIILWGGENPTALDEVEEVLLHHPELDIFQRGGELVQVRRIPEAVKPPGSSPRLVPLSSAAIMEVFEHVVQFQKAKSTKNGQIMVSKADCPPRLAEYYLARAGQWKLPVLAGVVGAPVVFANGEVLADKGYDRTSGLYLTGDGWDVPLEKPTKDDALAALETLKAPFAEFPFVGDEDLAAHMAAIITAIERPILASAPIFAYSKPTQRTGGTLLAESVAIIATGREAPAMAVAKDGDELRKTLLAVLRQGSGVVNLDNVVGTLDSQHLAQIVTAPSYQDRVLGETKTVDVSTKVLWTITGNNLSFAGDLTSRVVLCRLDAKVENPEAREFKIPNLKSYLAKHRRELGLAAVTIVRAWLAAGAPDMGLKNYGGFDSWRKVACAPLVWLGMADPCLTRQYVAEDDAEREGAARVLKAWHDHYRDSIRQAGEIAGTDDEDLRDALVVVVGHDDKINKRKLGWWLKKQRNRVVDGYRVERVGERDAAWRVRKVG